MLSLSNKTFYLKCLLQSPWLLSDEKKYILMLSHMRSRSSLLGHILGNNKDISGYSEMHMSYTKQRAFLRLKCKLNRDQDYKRNSKYLFDKILHNHIGITKEILNSDNVTVLFLVRDPLETLNSIIKMGEKIPDIEWYSNIEKATDYYVERLKKLIEYNNQINHQRKYYLDSERIISDTFTTLGNLTTNLKLTYPLTQKYELQKNTGRLGYGDLSTNITSGEVVKAVSENNTDHLPETYSSIAKNVYDYCSKHLTQSCKLI